MKFAINNEIKYIDTASSYGNAENVLGKYNLTTLNVISKFSPQEIGGKISFQLNNSLSKLNVSSLYALLAHNPLSLLNDERQWDELLLLRQNKLVKKIGFSLYYPNDLYKLIEKGMIPDLVQVPFNYFDTRFLDSIKELKKNGCEIHTRSTFLQGLFFQNPNNLSFFFEVAKPAIAELQLQYSNNLPSALLKYVIDLEFIDVVVLGIENLNQLICNLNNLGNCPPLKENNYKFSESILVPTNWPK